MLSTLRLQEPSGLVEARIEQAKWCLPFSYDVGEQRRGGRELYARYKPRSDDPVDFSGPGPLEWISRARAAAATGAAPTSSSPQHSGLEGFSRRDPAPAPAPAAATGAPGDPSPTASPSPSSSSAPPHAPSSASPSLFRPPPAERPPCDSHLELVFPFSSNAALREQYQRFTTNHMRFGLLLEDLDTLAGDIAARHAGAHNRVLLTASIDRISWLKDSAIGEVTMSHDLRMAGQVVWAGRSSMEVMIELTARQADQWHFIGVAFFVLVARSPDRTGSLDVPSLVPQTQRERELFEQGKVHMQQRQQRRDAHWARRPPSSEEVALVHDLIRSYGAARGVGGGGGGGSGGPGSSSGLPGGVQPHLVPMQRTALQSSCLMHSQDRNVFDVIFGGHLLRLAFEHAFATAALHAGEYCDPLSMDDVAFLLPVPIGTLLRLTGQVVFAEGPVVRVNVRATKLEPGAPEQSVVTNTFSFAFRCPSGPVRRVVPETMVEAMEYVMGHRQHSKDEASQAAVAVQQAVAAQQAVQQVQLQRTPASAQMQQQGVSKL